MGFTASNKHILISCTKANKVARSVTDLAGVGVTAAGEGAFAGEATFCFLLAGDTDGDAALFLPFGLQNQGLVIQIFK